ncbi:MAG: sulfatase-like hydrolase/transferase [Planctomycetota bacterium]|jgi:arylsulfatase A-like enzyme|nr:sulfatase-like hydrolase/transferase [Planctomycetota bacterium]
MTTPKNVLILCTDEMRGDALGIAGNRDCKTPNMDALLRRGAFFSGHCSNHTKCVPSRVTLVTGRYSHSDGFRAITQELPADRPCLLKQLRGHGYESAVFGKNHCWANFYGDNSRSSGAVDYTTFTDDYHDWWRERKARFADAPHGAETEAMQWLLGQTEGYGKPGAMGVQGNTAAAHWADDLSIDQAIDFLTTRRDATRPFFMQINLEAPHPGYGVPEPYCSMYDRAAVTPYPTALPVNASLPLRAQRERRSVDAEHLEAATRELQAVYYGMVSRVDDQFGRVMQTLSDQNLWGETVVLLWSDHGDFAGQYGLPEKWDSCFNDCLLRVPCGIVAPNIPAGTVVDSLTETVDLAPTILELLGHEPLPDAHGESLLPVIAGEKRKRAVFADGGHERAMRERWAREWQTLAPMKTRQLDAKQTTYIEEPDALACAKMVRIDSWKLIWREAGGHELYNLTDDPQEMDNRYGAAGTESVTAELLGLLMDWTLRTDPDQPQLDRFGA